MLPDPLHPAIVHLPIALAILLPLCTGCAAVAIHTGLLPRSAWFGVVLLGFVLVLSSWAALETGEDQEERVERVVAAHFIEEHQDAAKIFTAIGAVLFFVTMAGLVEGKTGDIARGISVLLALGLLAAGVQVGRLGGALVYEHGATLAYARGGPSAAGLSSGAVDVVEGKENKPGAPSKGEDDDDD